MAEKIQDIYLQQGKSQPLVLRCEAETPVVYKPIATVQLTAPLRLTTAVPHGCLDGWRAAITGLKDIDTEANKVRDKDYHAVTVIDTTTLDINDINATAFKAYVSGGVLQYNTPLDLTGYAGRLDIRTGKGKTLLLVCTKAGTSGTARPTSFGTDGTAMWTVTTSAPTKTWSAGTAYVLNDVIDAALLFSMTTANNLIAIDNALKTVTLFFDAADFTGLSWKKGYYELELFKTITRNAAPIVQVYSPLEGFLFLDTENTK